MSGEPRLWVLTGPDGEPVRSAVPGVLGGCRRTRIYGRLDCPAALRALRRGSYAAQRVFFADERSAVAAGYRPCGACLRDRHARWKTDPERFRREVSGESASADRERGGHAAR